MVKKKRTWISGAKHKPTKSKVHIFYDGKRDSVTSVNRGSRRAMSSQMSTSWGKPKNR